MSCGCGCGGDQLRHFTVLSGRDLACTVGVRAIDIVDKARDILTRAGLRRYRVAIVREAWSGKRRGVGVLDVEHTLMVLPTPKVTDLTSLAEVSSPGGITEQGSLVVSEISGRYNEDVLLGLDGRGQEPDPNVEVFWEITFLRSDGQESARRRFAPASVPSYDPSNFEWTIRLERARPDRLRSGNAA